MVYHACVDGFSRKVIYLQCLNNNKAASVLQLFSEGVVSCGLPRRVRGDRGTENIRVAEFMLRHRGLGRGSFITGRSVHNTRVERLWAEVNRVVTKPFKEHFLEMEAAGYLDEHDELDVYSLHYVYLPRIRQSCEEFVRQWNRHTLRTEGLSPEQMWTTGMMAISDADEDEDDTPLMINSDTDEDDEEIDGIVTRNNVAVPENVNLPENVVFALSQLVPDVLIDDGLSGLLHFITVRNYLRNL